MIKVLHVSPAYFPATYWGGPIHSLLALCNALHATGRVDLRVLTTDASGPRWRDRLPRDGAGIPPFGYEVTYAKKTLGADVSLELLAKLAWGVAWADVVHLTGAYSFPTIPTLVACRMQRKPLVWSPRGAFQRWSGSTRRGLKYGWERCCELLLRPGGSVIHVTSELERSGSEGRVRGAPIEVIPNGVDIPAAPAARTWRSGGALNLVYVGRLHPIKGLENLLRGLAQSASVPWRLRVCGDGDPAYARELNGLCAALGIEPRVQFVGHVDNTQKTGEFLAADACVVPSFSESFGMVVVEALANGVPVIVSRGAPWEEIEARGCGSWVDNSPESLGHAIASLEGRDLEEMGRRGRTWMMESFGWEAVASQMLGCYGRLVGDR